MRIVVLLLLLCSVMVSMASADGVMGDVPLRRYEGVWTHRPVRFVTIGDSLSAGYLSDHYHRYVDLLVYGDPDAARPGPCLWGVFPAIGVEEHAVSGTVSWQHEKQVRQLRPSGPRTLGWVVITSGANDLLYGAVGPPFDGALRGATMAQAQPLVAGFEQRLDRMFAMLDARFPGGCEIFIANIYDPTDGVGDIEHCFPGWMRGMFGIRPWPNGEAVMAAYNDAIARAAARRHNVHVIDLHARFLGHGLHCDDRANPDYHADDASCWFMSDFLHPSQQGHEVIRRAFLSAMAQAWSHRREATGRALP